jgi:NADPH:quinone reductase-like Zn-dependent oxidoreductase
MKALRAHGFIRSPEEAVRALKVETLPVPKPGKGQVLVKMQYAPCNPAEILYVTGTYGIDRPLPATPGFEGCGTVVAHGGGLIARYMMGRRVATGGHECSGTWAEYCLSDATACLPLSAKLTGEQGGTALANPITAQALVGLAKGKKALVNTAAAGQLGKMISIIGRKRGLAVLDVVRRADQAEALRKAGAEVLVSEEPGFEERLAKRCKETGATLALDAVAGPMTGVLLNALPKEGEVVVYGNLSGSLSGGIESMQLAFGHKKVRGFEIAAHLKRIGVLGAMRMGNAAQAMVARGEVQTDIRRKVKLDEAPTALAEYVREMSKGKMLFELS